MVRRLFSAMVVVMVGLLFSFSNAEAKDKLVMGVHPFKPVVELHKIFEPIAAYIAKETGKQVELQIAQTYEDAAFKVGTGKFDFSFLGPAIYVDAQKQYGVVPLAQVMNNGKPFFQGAIIAKKGSGITSVKQLKGKKFAFGEQNSTLGHVSPVWMLLKAGIKPSDLASHPFLMTHDNVAMNVIRGTVDAGGVMPDIAEKYKDQGLEIIGVSPELPEHVFVATKGLDAGTVAAIQKALISSNAAPVLKGIKGSISGARKFTDADFDILRKVMKEAAPYMKM